MLLVFFFFLKLFFDIGIELYYKLKHPLNFKQGIEISVEEGSTSTSVKTITSSSTHLELVSSSSGTLITSQCKTSSPVSL